MMLLGKLLFNILDRIGDEVDKARLLTEESIKERLKELQFVLERGEITEEEYEGLEEVLIARLKLVRQAEGEV